MAFFAKLRSELIDCIDVVDDSRHPLLSRFP